MGAALDRIADTRKTCILDLSAVPFLDSTAADVIEGAARKAARAGVRVCITGTTKPIRRTVLSHGVRAPLMKSAPTIAAARQRMERAAAPA